MTSNQNNSLDWYRPGLGESWIIALLLLLGSLVFGLFLALLKAIAPGATQVWELQSLVYPLTFVLPAIFIAVRANAAKRDAVMSGAIASPVNAPFFGKAGAAVIFILAALVIIAFVVMIDPLANLIPMPDLVKEIFEAAFKNTGLWDGIVATCILAPILEELLCRGIMCRGMLSRMDPWKAIFWSALIFAVIHMNPWQAIPAFLMGLLFGWLYYRTRCLWLTIFLHCLNNSIATVTMRMFPDMGMDQGLIDLLPKDTYMVVYAVSLVVFAAAIYILYKVLPKRADE